MQAIPPRVERRSELFALFREGWRLRLVSLSGRQGWQLRRGEDIRPVNARMCWDTYKSGRLMPDPEAASSDDWTTWCEAPKKHKKPHRRDGAATASASNPSAPSAPSTTSSSSPMPTPQAPLITKNGGW
jgi:hypothetical protein